jgi:hypothetical protein
LTLFRSRDILFFLLRVDLPLKFGVPEAAAAAALCYLEAPPRRRYLK